MEKEREINIAFLSTHNRVVKREKKKFLQSHKATIGIQEIILVNDDKISKKTNFTTKRCYLPPNSENIIQKNDQLIASNFIQTTPANYVNLSCLVTILFTKTSVISMTINLKLIIVLFHQ